MAPPEVEIVVPVHDEERDLGPSIRRLHAYLLAGFPFSTHIVIADNGSTDGTWAIAQGLACELPGVRAVRIAQKGRGRALHAVWGASEAAVAAYMDVDLSTDLAALLPLVAPLLSGHSDLAIGSRLARGSRVRRGPKRELISRGYNRLLRVILGTGFSDAQCGFKAIRTDRARTLLPLVQDTDWFFDTELLVLAERSGLRIHEVPVDWVDDADSRVDIVATAVADLKGIARLARGTPAMPGLPVQVVRFAGIGLVSTVAYLAIFMGLRTVMAAQVANLVALLATAVGNTAANRRFTFAVRGGRTLVRHHMQGLAVFGLAFALTSGSLTALHAAAGTPAPAVEAAVLVAANLAAAALRFVLFRGWIFARPSGRAVLGGVS